MQPWRDNASRDYSQPWRNNNRGNVSRGYEEGRQNERTLERRYKSESNYGAQSHGMDRTRSPYVPRKVVDFEVVCYGCGKKGHIRYNFPKNQWNEIHVEDKV